MNQVARMSAAERALAFEQAAAKLGIASAIIIEKDFWVCWTLAQVFAIKKLPVPLFKGGTSLSKAYKLIERFSEDVDLVINRHSLGFKAESDPAEQAGSNQRQRSLKVLTNTCRGLIRDELRPALEAQFRNALPDIDWTLQVDSDDPQCLLFAYPGALKIEGASQQNYLKPVIRLEFGCRGDVWPSEKRCIKSYLADVFHSSLAR